MRNFRFIAEFALVCRVKVNVIRMASHQSFEGQRVNLICSKDNIIVRGRRLTRVLSKLVEDNYQHQLSVYFNQNIFRVVICNAMPNRRHPS